MCRRGICIVTFIWIKDFTKKLTEQKNFFFRNLFGLFLADLRPNSFCIPYFVYEWSTHIKVSLSHSHTHAQVHAHTHTCTRTLGHALALTSLCSSLFTFMPAHTHSHKADVVYVFSGLHAQLSVLYQDAQERKKRKEGKKETNEFNGLF